MDTCDVEGVAGMSTCSVHDKDEHPDVLQPSPSTDALNTTSKNDENDAHLVGVEENLNLPPFSLRPCVVQASDQTANNDEITENPSLTGPQPRLPITSEPCKEMKILSTTTAAIPPSFLLPCLKKLGMSHAIGEDSLTQMLHSSGYLDANAKLDFVRFILFDSDFKLLEALEQEFTASSIKPAGTSDLGQLGEFFKILQEAGTRECGLKARDFVNAFNALETNLTFADGYSLERYSRFRGADKQDFDRFLRKRHCPPLDQARTVYLDRSQRLHRIMLFVSIYARRKRDKPSSSRAESGVCSLIRSIFCCRFRFPRPGKNGNTREKLD